MAKQYLAVIRESEFDPKLVTEKMWNDAMAAHAALAAAVEEAGGSVLFSGGLDAGNAVAITPGSDGKPAVFSDGPFAETKEINHGFHLLELPDEADARALATMIHSGGDVEFYPVMTEADEPR
ncbi:YciI family protein [Arthrobacter sp. H35-D1]|uniref:YciI family protein n=1 Tax=Arthrobacter sp. H35-D1 TaxID=3046202 RepID=UPI0024B9472B|nr:YciI family protein [Arthrobacter sp. H35-D1]MDJ0313905.1 YciI family protein [Arthrobacter sp. H35-D1]